MNFNLIDLLLCSLSPSPTSSMTGADQHHVITHSDHVISHGSLHHSLATDALWQQQNLIAYSQWDNNTNNNNINNNNQQASKSSKSFIAF